MTSSRGIGMALLCFVIGGYNLFGQARLTHDGAFDGEPAWSPDGSQIAFVSNRNGNWDIYTMDADGDNRNRLTTDPAYDGEPAWSPDGLKIVFVSTRNTGGGPAQAQARGATPYIMNVDGSAQYRFTKSTLPVWDPEYSPSGDRIVFSSRHDGNWEIYVMNADGSEQVNLSQSPADDQSPRWAPDDRRIAFVSDRDGNAEIYVLDSVNTADPAASGPRGHDPQPE